MPAGRRPGPSTTADEVLTAALRLFAERGFTATTIRAIAAAAGVNPALVYHHFGDKQRLETARLPDGGFRAEIRMPFIERE